MLFFCMFETQSIILIFYNKSFTMNPGLILTIVSVINLILLVTIIIIIIKFLIKNK